MKKLYQLKMSLPKITIIGTGNVGSHIVSQAIALQISAEFILVDHSQSFEDAQILDLKDAMVYSSKTKISGANLSDKAVKNSDIIIITAGASQKNAQQTRCDLLQENIKILQSIKDEIGEINSNALIILISNPVDILTYFAGKIFKLPNPSKQVFGTGTLLDTARMHWHVGDKLNKNANEINGYVMGEHGDSQFIAWSSVENEEKIFSAEKNIIAKAVQEEAYEIIAGKGATFFGIGAATAHLLQTILSEKTQGSILPLSVTLEGEYGLKNIALGVPVQIGINGIEKVIELKLNDEETAALKISATKIQEMIAEIDSCQNQ